jgi:hypothetical protein
VCDGSGEINGEALQPGDTLRVRIYRDIAGETSSGQQVRALENALKVDFGL